MRKCVYYKANTFKEIVLRIPGALPRKPHFTHTHHRPQTEIS